MKISAQNQIKGTLKSIEIGIITAKVTLDIGGGNEIVAIISKNAISELALVEGKEAFAIIKSTEVIIGTAE
jgi:molybdopterin-binding protein